MSQPPSYANIGLTSAPNQYFTGTQANDLVVFSTNNKNVYVGQAQTGAVTDAGSNYVQVGTAGISIVTGSNSVVMTSNMVYASNVTLTSNIISPMATHSNVMTSNLAVAAPLMPNNPVVAMTSYASPNAAGAFYVASASTESNANSVAWYAFDNAPTTYWQASNALYSATGAYAGFNNTPFTVINLTAGATNNNTNSNVNGEWLQLQMPTGILATSATITCSNVSNTTTVPAKVTLLGSSDGTNWKFVASNATPNTNATLTLTPASDGTSTSSSANYFRLVTSSNGVANAPAITSFNIAGTPKPFTTTDTGSVGIGVDQPMRALEVAGNFLCSGNISAGNLGMFRNRIINGNMGINQRGNLSLTNNTSAQYHVDRFMFGSPGSIGTSSNVKLIPADLPFKYGHKFSLKHTVTANVTTNYIIPLEQVIEGYNISDLNWGTPFGSPITVSFWSRSLGSTILSISIRNSGYSYSYVSNITVLGNNTWQYNTITVPSPPSLSVWDNVNNAGLSLVIGSYSYAPYQTPTSNAWVPGNFICSTTTSPWINTANNFVEFTGVQLEKGTMATPFEFRPYQIELQLCQRYYENSFPPGIVPQANYNPCEYITCGLATSTTTTFGQLTFKVQKRTTTSTIYIWNPWLNVAANTSLRVPNGGTDVAIASITAGGRCCTVSFTSATAYTLLANYEVICEL